MYASKGARVALRVAWWVFFVVAFTCVGAMTQPASADDPFKKALDELQSRVNPVDPSNEEALKKLVKSIYFELCSKDKPLNKLACYRAQLSELFRTLSGESPPDDKQDNEKAAITVLVKELSNAKLKGALLPILDAAKNEIKARGKIHIIAAYFGHFKDILDAFQHFERFDDLDLRGYLADRFCPATRAVRARCQGQETCLEGATLNGMYLCGREPAQYAGQRNRVLIVRYLCNTEPDWDPASNISNTSDDNNFIPKEFVHTLPTDQRGQILSSKPQWALLRPGETTRIMCAFPKDAPPVAAKQATAP